MLKTPITTAVVGRRAGRAGLNVAAAALAAVSGLLAAAPALAQAQAPAQAQATAQPTAEQVRLGVAFASQMLDLIDFTAIIAKSMSASFAGPTGDFVNIEPRWRDFVSEAINEEIRADHAAIVATMGRGFARSFTGDELSVGVALFRDPAMATVMKALAAGQPPPKGVNLQPATLQAMSSPAGRTFLVKFSSLDKLMEGSKNDLIQVIVPGFFQRFGDKAVALERQRRQAEGLPPPRGD